MFPRTPQMPRLCSGRFWSVRAGGKQAQAGICGKKITFLRHSVALVPDFIPKLQDESRNKVEQTFNDPYHLRRFEPYLLVGEPVFASARGPVVACLGIGIELGA